MKYLIVLLLALLGINLWNPAPVVTDGDWEVTIKADSLAEQYGVFTYTQTSGEPVDIKTDGDFWLEVEKESDWQALTPIGEGPEIYGTLRVGGTQGGTSEYIQWDDVYGILPQGRYRLGKVFYVQTGVSQRQEQTAYVEFQVGFGTWQAMAPHMWKTRSQPQSTLLGELPAMPSNGPVVDWSDRGASWVLDGVVYHLYPQQKEQPDTALWQVQGESLNPLGMTREGVCLYTVGNDLRFVLALKSPGSRDAIWLVQDGQSNPLPELLP